MQKLNSAEFIEDYKKSVSNYLNLYKEAAKTPQITNSKLLEEMLFLNGTGYRGMFLHKLPSTSVEKSIKIVPHQEFSFSHHLGDYKKYFEDIPKMEGMNFVYLDPPYEDTDSGSYIIDEKNEVINERQRTPKTNMAYMDNCLNFLEKTKGRVYCCLHVKFSGYLYLQCQQRKLNLFKVYSTRLCMALKTAYHCLVLNY